MTTNSLFFPPIRLNIGRLHRALRGKTILITGASYGIGEATAILCAAEGVRLLLVARTRERLEVVADEAGRRGAATEIYALDLRNDEARRQLTDRLRNDRRGIDVFVSNAGLSICRSIFDSTDRLHDFTRTMAINYTAPVALTLALIDKLKQCGGQLIHISAASALLPPAPMWAAYQASKCAFDQWLGAAAPELRRVGIAVGTVYLPLVRTRMIDATAAYRSAPAMPVAQAARIVGRMMLNRRRRWQPWWVGLAAVVATPLRPVWEWAALRIYTHNHKKDKR